MRGMMLVARRELAAYFNSYWGWVVIAVILLIDGLLFNAMAMGDKPKYSSDVIQEFFWGSFGCTVIASLPVTMRLFAEEKQTGTMVLLDSAPLSRWQLLGGKYVSALLVMAVLVLSTFYMPALVFVNGKVSYGHIFAGYLGLMLVAAAATAVGTLGSAISRHQIVAFVISTLLLAFLVLAWLLARVADPPLKEVLSYLSFYDQHFRGFGEGKVSTESVVYFLSVTFVSLLLASRFLAARRWR
jgi:ABC-2 type transport system permease protein